MFIMEYTTIMNICQYRGGSYSNISYKKRIEVTVHTLARYSILKNPASKCIFLDAGFLFKDIFYTGV